jgi:putative ABC transport system ATP-binding protein
MAAPVIDMDHVRRRFESPAGPVEALRDVSFTVSAGETVAVVGASGSGKSTLLYVLGLLDRPTSGAFLLDGEPVDGFDERRRASIRSREIGFVFQAFHLLRGRSVAENVAVGLSYAGIPRRDRPNLVAEALEAVGMGYRRDAAAETLSGGEQQRVAMARAIATGPRLLLCDEPTGNLDRANTDAVLEVLAALSQRGTTVVLITHDEQVAASASRRLSMDDGKLRA